MHAIADRKAGSLSELSKKIQNVEENLKNYFMAFHNRFTFSLMIKYDLYTENMQGDINIITWPVFLNPAAI